MEAYLDNAATMPMVPEALAAMTDAMKRGIGNPSSQHAKGREAKKLLEESREAVADAIGAKPDEVYFTSGGTESNNLALNGVCWAWQREHSKPGSLAISALEHPSVTKPARALRREGWDVCHISAVGGNLSDEELDDALSKPDLALLSVMTAQSEFGYVFDAASMVSKRDASGSSALVHTDAVQAFGKLDVNVKRTGIDMMSMSAHKIGGPVGIGALYVRNGVNLFSTALGGGQERGLRSGTESVALAAGFAAAAKKALANREEAFEKASSLREYTLSHLADIAPGMTVNSRDDGSPYVLNISIPDFDNREVLSRLSNMGVYVSASTACASNKHTVEPGTWRPKHPLPMQLAGIPKSQTLRTYRISLSQNTTLEEMQMFLEAMQKTLQSLRADSETQAS